MIQTCPIQHLHCFLCLLFNFLISDFSVLQVIFWVKHHFFSFRLNSGGIYLWNSRVSLPKNLSFCWSLISRLAYYPLFANSNYPSFHLLVLPWFPFLAFKFSHPFLSWFPLLTAFAVPEPLQESLFWLKILLILKILAVLESYLAFQ